MHGHFASFALLVLVDGYVERPVEFVLNLPMIADVGVEAAVCQQATDIVAHLAGLLAANAACRLDPDDGLQLRPVLVVHPYKNQSDLCVPTFIVVRCIKF